MHVWPAITQTGPFTRTFVFPSWSKISFCWFKNYIFLLNFGIPIWENISSLFLRSGFLRSCYYSSLALLLNLFWGQPNGLCNQRLNFIYDQKKAKKREQIWKCQNWSFLKKQEISRRRQEIPKTQHQGRNKKIFEKIFHNFHGKTKAPNERAGILRARGGINLVISSTVPLCKNLV